MKKGGTMDVTCGKCDYSWDYQGSKTVYAVCPNCRKIVRLPQAQAEMGNPK